jgi:hypothetical protein
MHHINSIDENNWTLVRHLVFEGIGKFRYSRRRPLSLDWGFFRRPMLRAGHSVIPDPAGVFPPAS